MFRIPRTIPALLLAAGLTACGGGLSGAHHGELGPRPGQTEVVAHLLGVHDDVCAAVRFAQDDADARHRRPPVGEHELSTVADHAAPLEVLAGVEPGGVDEGDDRQVERVAEGHEPGCLLRRRNVEGAGENDGLIGENADHATIDPRQDSDGIRGPAGAQFEKLAQVSPEDVATFAKTILVEGNRTVVTLASTATSSAGVK